MSLFEEEYISIYDSDKVFDFRLLVSKTKETIIIYPLGFSNKMNSMDVFNVVGLVKKLPVLCLLSYKEISINYRTNKSL